MKVIREEPRSPVWEVSIHVSRTLFLSAGPQVMTLMTKLMNTQLQRDKNMIYQIEYVMRSDDIVEQTDCFKELTLLKAFSKQTLEVCLHWLKPGYGLRDCCLKVRGFN